jgi:hypothetical protein
VRSSAGCRHTCASLFCHLDWEQSRPTRFGVVRGGGTVFVFEPGKIGAGRMDLFLQSAALRICS